MDILHRPEEFPFISDVVDIMEFFMQGLEVKEELVKKHGGGEGNGDGSSQMLDRDEAFAKEMGISMETVAELAELCDPEKLKCGYEEDRDPLDDYIPPEGKQHLVTLAIQSRELEKRKNMLSYRQMACQLHKYRRTNFQLLDGFRDANDTDQVFVNYVPPDVLLTVSLAQPYNRVLEYHEIRLGRLLAMDSVFQVLGCLPLTALRDKISCLCDWSVMHDASENTRGVPGCLAKDSYPSGFFYINGVFYNDKRDPKCMELSAPIMEWAQRRSDEVGPFTVANMEETRFVDLKLRLGQPYVYVHQGTCEHLMIFSDLRMLSSSDSQNIPDYPLQISLKPKKRVPCSGCKIYTAKWVVYGNTDLPFDPSFFCEQCYRTFNHGEEGDKVGDFQAMPYFDRSILP